jgi:L-alanine-DL-glutamate epimerase-like enolase superfamily enzyme
MTSASRILRLQSGEPGPIAAAIAGIDIALCDLAAKRAEQPLWRWLGGARGRVRVYASLGRADPALPTLERWLARGFTAVLSGARAFSWSPSCGRRARWSGMPANSCWT